MYVSHPFHIWLQLLILTCGWGRDFWLGVAAPEHLFPALVVVRLTSRSQETGEGPPTRCCLTATVLTPEHAGRPDSAGRMSGKNLKPSPKLAGASASSQSRKHEKRMIQVSSGAPKDPDSELILGDGLSL